MMENHKISPIKDINKEINSWENMGNGSKTTTKNEVIG